MDRKAIRILGIYGLATTIVVTLMNLGNPKPRAVIGMAWGLILLWVFLFGGLMVRYKDPLRDWIVRIRLPWRVKFVILCIFLALLEEAITVTMTNSAPLFGMKLGEAYITASANYLDVVCCHSVVMFVGMFVGWAWLLGRYDFSPTTVFLLFGLTGTLAEMSFGGPQALIAVGFWTFIYGLMVYLPAYATQPERQPGIRPRPWHYVLAVFLPFVFAMPIAALVGIFVHHPRIHFAG